MTDTDQTTEAEAEPTAPPDELREGLLARFNDELGDAVVESHIKSGLNLWVRVSPDAWRQAAHLVRYGLGARFFDFISAIDWKPSPFGRSMDSEVDNVLTPKEAKELPEMTSGYAGGDTRFQVLARVVNVVDNWGVILKADVPDDEPRIDSWVPVYSGADWHERETWEMFGIDFVGHPGLRHIYLPSQFEGHPLRKDFPLLSRMVKPWPGIVDVEPMPGNDDAGEGDGEAGGEA